MDTTHGARRWCVFLLICIVGGLVYSPIMNADFSCDDICFIAWVDHAKPIDYLYRFIPFKGEMVYRPLFVVIWSFYYWIWGANAPLFHIQLVAAHLLNAWLLFLIVFRLSRRKPVSLITALLFVSTPLSVETVAWINGIDDVYCMMFSLLSLLYFIKIDECPASRRWMILLSLLFGLIALFIRESAVTLPLAVLFCDFIVIRARKGKSMITYLRERGMLYGYYFLLVLSFFIIRCWMLGGLMGYGAGGKTYVPPILDIARNACLRLPGIMILPLKYSTIQKIFPGPLAHYVTQPYFLIAASLILCVFSISLKKIQWRFVVFGLGWCFAAILAHWQVLHSIGLIAGNLEFSHYLYQPAAGFYLAVSALFICGQAGWRKALATSIMVALILAYSLVSLSYCTLYRHSFHVAHAILNQFKNMKLSLPQGSLVFLMDVPTHIEGAPIWWGGTSITVWTDPEPSVKPVFEKGLWHYSLEPIVRERYPYRIFMLNRDVELEKRRNEYEAPPRFTLDYLRSLKPGETDYFLQWLPGEERLVDISGRVRERIMKPPPSKALLWAGGEIAQGGAGAPFGDARWGEAVDRGAVRLSIGSGGGGLGLERASVSPDEFGSLEMEFLLLKPGKVEAALEYRTEEENRFDRNKRVVFSLSATPDFNAVRVPLTRRIYDLIDGRITGIRIAFPAGNPVEIEIGSISLR